MKKRILFVDDEPNVLQGLQRILRPLRDEWEMTFVGSGREALDRLTQEPVDVIVSDMRMPTMDGVQLLTEVMRRHPEVVRIGLSGQSDEETALRALGPTHQYLSKPCDPEVLKAVVTRASALRELLTDPILTGLVAGMKSLPSLPSLFLEVVEALKQPDISVHKISRLIEQDVAMAAKILQLVNSAFFGLRRRVDDLSRAISLLGFNTIKTLVLSVHLFSQCDQARLKRFQLATLWEHSFTVGSVARSIARSESQEQSAIDAAFTAGLLHDTGKLVLATNVPELYDKALACAQARKIPGWEAEQATLGVSHAQIGAYLLGIWGLPRTIVETLAFHHCPAQCPEQMVGPLTAVHVADSLVYEQHSSKTASPQGLIDSDYLTKLGLADRLPPWREQSQALC